MKYLKNVVTQSFKFCDFAMIRNAVAIYFIKCELVKQTNALFTCNNFHTRDSFH